MHRVFLTLGATMALLLLAFGPSTSSARLPDDGADAPKAASFSGRDALSAAATADLRAAPPERNTHVKLASGALRDAVSRLRRGQPAGSAVRMVDQLVRVEILHHLPEDGIEALVLSAGGTIDGRVPGILVEGLVPWQRLEALEASQGVDYIRPPLNASMPIYDPPQASSGLAQGLSGAVVGQEVAKTNADDWHAAGYRGAGVKIGIIDGFDGTLWNSAQAHDELPAPSGTFCKIAGGNCDIWAFGVSHGEGVAEIIHEMAPEAQLYLASAGTTSDLQAAVDYFDTQGVDIISRSLTSAYDGPGDGTGPIATVINNAVADGMVWLNAAGNNAGGVSAPFEGAYWRGGWADGDLDGNLDFGPGQELLPFFCGMANGVRWNDWGANRTDYDVYVYDDEFGLFLQGGSENDQGGGFDPLELTGYACDGPSDIDYLRIVLYSAGNGTAGDVLEFMVNLGKTYYWQNSYSASGPASDSASPGMISVGAIDPPNGTAIANYSSHGPTNDSRTKPDLSAAACVSSYTYAPQCFNGTSSATPAVAGAAALVIDAGLASTPSQLKTWLLNNATVDRGSAGTDNVYGKGELILPAPPAAPTPTPTPPTPSPTPTPTPTHSPTPTASSTGTATPTTTPTPTPTPTGTPGAGGIAGDVDCSGGVNSVDSLKILRHVAALSVAQNEPCPDIGTSAGFGFAAPQGASSYKQGDVDCNASTNSVDALKVLRYVAGLSVAQTEPCPDIGTPTGGGATPTPTPTPTHTGTPAATASKTPTPTPSKTPTPSATPSATPTPTPTPSQAPTPPPTVTPTPSPASLTLRKTTAYYDTLGALWVVGEVSNDSDHAVSLVKITANFYSASNSLLAAKDGYACLTSIAGGGHSSYSVLLLNPPSGIDHYTYQITNVFDPAPFALPVGLQTSISNTYLDGGIWHTVGTIKNNSSTRTFTSVRACGAYYNASGDVIRTHPPLTAPSTLSPGETASFDVFAVGVALEATSVEVIADGQ